MPTKTFCGFDYDGIEVAACVNLGAGELAAVDTAQEAMKQGGVKVISVYLHLAAGHVECIADCPIREYALAIADALAAGTNNGVTDRTWEGCEVQS